MRSHVAKTVSTCHAVLRQLRTIRRSVSRSVLQSLVTSLVLSRLDYGNATLAGVSSYPLITAAVSDERRCSSYFFFIEVSPHYCAPASASLAVMLQSGLHSNMHVLVYTCLHGSAPAYLIDELCQVADVDLSRLVGDSVPVHLRR